MAAAENCRLLQSRKGFRPCEVGDTPVDGAVTLLTGIFMSGGRHWRC